jgi:hypothetical protein
MARPTCEGRVSIDVRRWHREGRLQAGQDFTCSWTYGGKPFGSISVRTEEDAVVLAFPPRNSQGSDWKSVEQRVPITWTACHLGGRRGVVSLRGLLQRSVLRAPRRVALRCWRIVRLPALLRLGLCKPTGNAHVPGRAPSANH